MTAMTDFFENEVVKATFRSHAIVAHAISTAYTVGARVWATNVYGPFVFECITAGTSAATEPAYNTTLGATTADGTVTWKCYHIGTLKRPLWFALLSAAPTEAGALTELSGGAYARAQLDPSDANWAATVSGDGHTQNSAVIQFPTATADWVTATHIAIMDAQTGGNPLFIGALTAARTVTNGTSTSFAIGDLDVTFA